MSLVTLAFRRSDVAGAVPAGSGFLVPPVEGRDHQGVHVRQPQVAVDRRRRARPVRPAHLPRPVRRRGAARPGGRGTGGGVPQDLGEAVGLSARPVATTVTRWIDGLPQYPVGHHARVADPRRRREAARPAGVRRRVRRCGHPGGRGRRVAGGRRGGRGAPRVPAGRPWRRALTVTSENSPMSAPEKIPNAGKKAKDLNEVIRYTLWSVFKLRDVLPEDAAATRRRSRSCSTSSPRRTSPCAARTTCRGCGPTRTS